METEIGAMWPQVKEVGICQEPELVKKGFSLKTL